MVWNYLGGILGTANAAERVQWLDAVRGLAIVLVVCYHGALMADAIGVAHPVWKQANAAMQLLRMPLFFFASGTLAANAIHRSWRQVAVPRVGFYLWLFVLWAAIETVVYSVLPSVRPRPSAQWSDLLTMFVIPDNGIWYLYALVLFFTVAKVTRKAPTWLMLGAGSLVSAVAASGVVPMRWVWQDMAMYAVFFLAGSRLIKPTLAFAANKINLPQVCTAAAVTGTGLAVVAWFEAFTVPGARLVISTLAVVTGIAFSVWLCAAGLARHLQSLGRQTLSIYVLHAMIMNAMAILLREAVPDDTPAFMSATAPIILIAVGLPLSILVSKPLKRISGVFTLPRIVSPGQRSKQSA